MPTRNLKQHLLAGSLAAFLVALGGAGYFLYVNYLGEGVSSHSTVITRGPVKEGAAFPLFRARDIENVEYSLAAAAPGHLRVINFWASWCGPCLQEIPSLFELAKKMQTSLEIVAISEDETLKDIHNAMKVFPNMQGLSIRVIHDSDKALMTAYAVSGLPESFIIGPDGVLMKHVVGTMNWMQPSVVDYFSSHTPH